MLAVFYDVNNQFEFWQGKPVILKYVKFQNVRRYGDFLNFIGYLPNLSFKYSTGSWLILFDWTAWQFLLRIINRVLRSLKFKRLYCTVRRKLKKTSLHYFILLWIYYYDQSLMCCHFLFFLTKKLYDALGNFYRHTWLFMHINVSWGLTEERSKMLWAI